ncbi:MAG: SpoIIE family protein phosphatase [Ignavibacteria bacterium]|nr:SpoIIE family protein phosphatase [Ignavibacteria bacterium]
MKRSNQTVNMVPDQLRHNVLFENVSEEHFLTARSRLIEHRYFSGQPVFRENTEGNAMFVIAKGRVKIVKTEKYGKECRLALLHAGDFFGELELVDGRMRSASAVAVDDSLIYALRRDDFDQLLRESHPFAVRLMQVLVLRLRALGNNFVREIELATQRVQTDLKRFDQIVEAAKIVNSTLDLEHLLAVILETALRFVDGDRGTVYLVDRNKRELWSKVLKGKEMVEIRLPLHMGIAGHVASTGEIVNIRNAYDDPRFNASFDRQSGYVTRTVLCMPMRNKDGTIIGVFQLLNKRSGDFTQDDIDFLDALSVHASLAIENARLYEQEREKLRMEKELFAAREVVSSLLPDQVPRLPGLDFAAYSNPAREVGGDYYDFIKMENDLHAISLGDVSGKGLPAALLMASAQATVRSQALATRSPGPCLDHSNNLLFHSTSAEKFVTMFLGILDPHTMRMTYCNAGHQYPLLLSPHRPETLYLKTGGIMLGMIEHFKFQEEIITLQQDDVLLVVSDGITEAMNSVGEQFGESRLEAVVRKHLTESAAEILEAVVAAVADHCASMERLDDMTLLAMKRTG